MHKRFTLFVLFTLLMTAACRKGDFNANVPPETKLSLEEINLSGENRLNSQVRLSWYGTDKDGYVEGYEISLDNVNWHFTNTQDSVFLFNLQAGQDTTDIDFFVRAIDDDGDVDPTPAYIKVPLKNSPPRVAFDDERGPGDTAFAATTFYWSASDPDGNQSINQVLVKFNDGEWTGINKNQNLISFLLDTAVSTGDATAEVYYGKNKDAENFTIDGLKSNGENVLYIKVVDIAGTESPVDTSHRFYLKNKTPGVNTLWLNAHSKSIAAEYRSFLNNQNINYDYLDYGRNQGANQPVYWDPTFRLILSLYDKLFVNAPSSRFPNINGQNVILLDYLAPIIQTFQDEGGKSFITTLLDNSLTQQDMANVAGAFPIEDIVRSPSGFVRIHQDSLVYNVHNNINTPDLQPQTIQTGVVPIVKTSDAEDFYRAEITRFGGWTGDNLVASVRRDQNGRLIQVFFALELHNYDAIPGTVEQLIGDILKDEF